MCDKLLADHLLVGIYGQYIYRNSDGCLYVEAPWILGYKIMMECRVHIVLGV